jgi:hypothetical protein
MVRPIKFGDIITASSCRMEIVRFGSKGDVCAAKRHVCFTLESGHVHCTRPCLLWANSGHRPLFDHLIGRGEQRRRNVESERLGGFKIEH